MIVLGVKKNSANIRNVHTIITINVSLVICVLQCSWWILNKMHSLILPKLEIFFAEPNVNVFKINIKRCKQIEKNPNSTCV